MNALIRRTALAACLMTGMALQNQAQTQPLSPAELRIAAAQKTITAKPNYHEAYTQLAMAFASRARETSDPAYYDRADEAVRKSLAISPNNYAARKAQTWILLGKHEFAKARELAWALTGGWNAGNGVVLGAPLDAHIDATALALLALRRTSDGQDIGADLDWLARKLGGCASLYSFALGVWALAVHGQDVDPCKKLLTRAALGSREPVAVALSALALQARLGERQL
jgi:hypothetical protein